MASAFHPGARLQYIRNGEVSMRSLEGYLGGVSGQSVADESERECRIMMVDYDRAVALTKIELDYRRAFFSDHMELLNVDGEWKIVNKIYPMEGR